MALLMQKKLDLTRTALPEMPGVHAARSRLATAQAACEAAAHALRACRIAQGLGDHGTTDSRPLGDYHEARRQRRLEGGLVIALDDAKDDLSAATRELAIAETAARAAIVAARHAGLKALAAELFAALAQVAEVNARAWDYEVKTAELLEESSTVAQVAWPEFFSEPNRESLLELRRQLARQAGLL